MVFSLLQCTPEQISGDLHDELMYQLDQDENLQKVSLVLVTVSSCSLFWRQTLFKTCVVQILSERDQLPVKQFEEEIMATIDSNPVVIIRGATGCGKTTQVPQYILDRFIKAGKASDCNIVVTQVKLPLCAPADTQELNFRRNHQIQFITCFLSSAVYSRNFPQVT